MQGKRKLYRFYNREIFIHFFFFLRLISFYMLAHRVIVLLNMRTIYLLEILLLNLFIEFFRIKVNL